MKIELRTRAQDGTTGQWILLADDDNTTGLADSVSGYRPSLSKSPQHDPLMFSNVSFIQDIGGSSWRLSFTVERNHADPQSALEFLVVHAAQINSLANVDLRVTVLGTSVSMDNCALIRFDPDPHSDQSTRCSYEFLGPSYTL